MKIALRIIGLASVLLLLLNSVSVLGHETEDDSHVRVVSADPETRTYTFSCLPEPDLGYVRDWFIYGERVGHNEAEFLDVPAGEHLTYTFEGDNYYHIGCLVIAPDGERMWRGDIHIDLRKELFDEDVIPLEADVESATLNCISERDPYKVDWWVSTYWGAPSEPTRRTKLAGDEKIVTYSAPGHGLYHPRCFVFDGSGQFIVEAGTPIEFFDDKPPYIADRWGIDMDGNFRPFDPEEWLAMFNGGSIPPPPSNSTPPSDNGTGTNSSNNQSGEPEEDTDDSQLNGTYHSVEDIPATCDGGLISSDTFTGSRKVTCVHGPSSLSIEAWNKPSNTAPEHFEMYKKAQDGTGIEICLGETCISNNGYAKSPPFPIGNSSPGEVAENGTGEDGNDGTSGDPGENATDSNETGNTSAAVYHTLDGIPAFCEDGTIVSDVYSGGSRRISCENGGGSLTIEAWDKPTSSSPDHFEMYRKLMEGSGLEICIADACIGGNGFARRDYPVMFGNQSGGNDTPDDGMNGSDPGAGSNETQSPEEENPSACFPGTAALEASCVGGEITQDSLSGSCRTLQCEGDSGAVKAFACDKPDSGERTHFEIYRQMVAGTPPKICLGSTCIQFNGYAKSEVSAAC